MVTRNNYQSENKISAVCLNSWVWKKHCVIFVPLDEMFARQSLLWSTSVYMHGHHTQNQNWCSAAAWSVVFHWTWTNNDAGSQTFQPSARGLQMPLKMPLCSQDAFLKYVIYKKSMKQDFGASTSCICWNYRITNFFQMNPRGNLNMFLIESSSCRTI